MAQDSPTSTPTQDAAPSVSQGKRGTQDGSLLRMENINKSFPGVKALSNVSFEVRAGEIHGLIGENGAGKSTLMKILSGVYMRDSGVLYLNGRAIEIEDPHQAQELGITIIYQEFNLMPNLTVAENVFIGREPNRLRFVRWRDLNRQTQDLLNLLGVELSPTARVRDLKVAEQQMVEIAKALSVQARIIVMDEPTSALTESEVTTLFGIMRNLKAQGLGVIFISHRLEEVFQICDRVTVLRDGRNVGTRDVQDVTKDAVIQMMVGRTLGELFQKEAEARQGDVVLEVRNVGRTGTVMDPSAIVLDRVSFTLRRGEILGLAGLVGSGRTDLARVLFGADQMDHGEVYIFNRDDGLTITENCLGATPNPDAIIGANDEMAFGALEAAKGQGIAEDVVIVGYDALPEALVMVRDGELWGTVDQFPGEQSRVGLRTLVDYIWNGTMPAEHDIFIEPKMITQDNLAEAERAEEIQ